LPDRPADEMADGVRPVQRRIGVLEHDCRISPVQIATGEISWAVGRRASAADRQAN
jgi:hypothetical protein